MENNYISLLAGWEIQMREINPNVEISDQVTVTTRMNANIEQIIRLGINKIKVNNIFETIYIYIYANLQIPTNL